MFLDPNQATVKSKSVRFEEDENVSESPHKLNAEQEYDVVIYRGYCAIKAVLDAMYFCAETSNWESLGALKPHHPDSDVSNSPSSKDCSNHIMEDFQQVQEILFLGLFVSGF